MWICPHYLISTPSPIRTGSATLNHNEIFVTLCVELWIAKYGDDFTKPWDHQKFVQNLSACLAATHILHSSDTLCAHSSQVFLEYKFWNAPEGGFFKTHIWALVTELLPCAQMLLLKLNYYSPILHSMADLIGLSFWASQGSLRQSGFANSQLSWLRSTWVPFRIHWYTSVVWFIGQNKDIGKNKSFLIMFSKSQIMLNHSKSQK